MVEDVQVKQYSDDVKRLCDSINMHAIIGNAGRWAAYKIQDCSTDNVAYPNRKEAVRMLWPNHDYYLYLQIPPDGCQLDQAETYLRYNRFLYERGWRMPDPDDIDPDTIPTMPNTRQDVRRQIRLLTQR